MEQALPMRVPDGPPRFRGDPGGQGARRYQTGTSWPGSLLFLCPLAERRDSGIPVDRADR